MSLRVTGRWIPVAQVRNDESRQEAGPGAGCVSPCPVLAAQAALRPFLWDLLFLDRSGKQDSANSVQVRSEEEGAAANLLESGAVGLQINPLSTGQSYAFLPFIPVSAEGAFPTLGPLAMRSGLEWCVVFFSRLQTGSRFLFFFFFFEASWAASSFSGGFLCPASKREILL